MSYTKGEWKSGYGTGITGPETPTVAGPTCCESVAFTNWTEKDDDSEAPQIQHTIVRVSSRTIAIVPTINKIEGEANARLIAAAPKLLDACEAWMLVESEMGDNHPCPDYTLRAQYRKNAVKLTKAAIALVKE